MRVYLWGSRIRASARLKHSPSLTSACAVERTDYALPAAIEHMRVDHCGRDILVSEQLLDRADILSGFEQMRRERVTQGMACCRLVYAGAFARKLDCALNRRLIDVMPAHAAAARIA